MNLFFSKPFVRDYRKLPKQIQTAIDKQIEFLLSNPRHPSLNIKKMNDPREIWEGRITKSYRFTYQIERETYVLRRVGTHGILKNPYVTPVPRLNLFLHIIICQVVTKRGNGNIAIVDGANIRSFLTMNGFIRAH